MTNEKEEKKEVIILNKPFLGGWLNKEGRIGHEIIDFFLADKNKEGKEKYYIYNNPRGACPADIWVGDSDTNDYGLKRKNREKYIAKYMVLTSDAHAMLDEKDDETESSKKSAPKTFNILYVIELTAKIHRFNTGKSDDNGLKKGQKRICDIIKKHEIRYNGALLNEIYGDDDSLYLTFEAETIYEVKEGEILTFEPKTYNFQRNKGYIKSDSQKHKDDYKKLCDTIDEATQNGGALVEWKLRPLAAQEGKTYHAEKTFLDLISYTDNEQAFTNMLHTLFQNGDVFKAFCKEFKKDGAEFAEEETFKVWREKRVEGGRIDVCGDSEKQRVIIENKIHSGVNGYNDTTKTSQLSTYYNKWGKVEGKKEPLCFITVPDYRKSEIEAEIDKFDPIMKKENTYKVVTYSEIANFIEKNKALFKNDELIFALSDQIVSAFKKWSYKSRKELYTGSFLKAAQEAAIHNKMTTK